MIDIHRKTLKVGKHPAKTFFFKQTTFLGYYKEKLIYLNQDFLPHFTELQLGKGDLAYNEHDFK